MKRLWTENDKETLRHDQLPTPPAAAKQKETRLVTIRVVEIRPVIFIVAK
jgi:hypothetical protein